MGSLASRKSKNQVGGPPDAQTPSTRRRSKAMQLSANVVLPIAIAIATAVAGVNHGSAKVYWYIGVVLGLFINGLISYAKDRAATAVRNAAIRTETDLATGLNDTGRPLVVALANVTACESPEDARREVAVLIDRAVSLAQTVLASSSDSHTRAAYYCIEGNCLERKLWHGWTGSTAPRMEFVNGRSDHDDEVIRFAHGENALLVEDLENYPPPRFIDNKGRVYKSFVSVPVRAGSKTYGLLTADSDRAYALTGIDRGLMILIAGVLGAGVAHVEAVTSKTQHPISGA